jgi:hypothetical protein
MKNIFLWLCAVYFLTDILTYALNKQWALAVCAGIFMAAACYWTEQK